VTFQPHHFTSPASVANEQKLSTDSLGPRGGHKFHNRGRGGERMPAGISLGDFLGDVQVVCAAPQPRTAWAYSPSRGWIVVRAEDWEQL
jgi:hypothetical protein